MSHRQLADVLEGRMFSILLLFLKFLTIFCDPVDQRRSEILVKKDGKEVDAKGYLGDTATAKIPDLNHATIRFQGSKDGPLRSKSGHGGADKTVDNSSFSANYGDGSKGHVKTDKSKMSAFITDDKKDSVKASVNNPQTVGAYIVSGQGKTVK